MKWFKKLLCRLTGGRPMKVRYLCFVDKVTHRPVFKCTDKFGRWWLAEHRWARHRVRANPSLGCAGFRTVKMWKDHEILKTFQHERNL